MRELFLKDKRWMMHRIKQILCIWVAFMIIIFVWQVDYIPFGLLNLYIINLLLELIYTNDINSAKHDLPDVSINVRKYVMEKYIFSLLCIGVGWLLDIILRIFGVMIVPFSMQNIGLLSFLTLFVSIYILAIVLPFSFKYGRKSHWSIFFALAILVLCVSVITYVPPTFFEKLENLVSAIGCASGVFILIAIGIFMLLISMKISVTILHKKLSESPSSNN